MTVKDGDTPLADAALASCTHLDYPDGDALWQDIERMHEKLQSLEREIHRLKLELQKTSDSELLARLGDREVSRLRECEDHLRQWELWAADVDSRGKTVQ